MEIVKYQKGQMIALKNDKVKYWYLIQQGSVLQKFDFTHVVLQKNSVIGMLERDIYLCDYEAAEDVVMAAFVCNNTNDLKNILSGQDIIRNIFLKSAVEGRHNLLQLYSELHNKADFLHKFIQDFYNDYKELCAAYDVEESSFTVIEQLKPLVMYHKAEQWEIDNSTSLFGNYLAEYLHLMEKDDGMTVGAIMEISAQMRRFRQGIGELESYLTYNREILLSEHESDIFKLYTELGLAISEKKIPINQINEKINEIVNTIYNLNLYNERTISRFVNEYKKQCMEVSEGKERVVRKEFDISSIDGIGYIMNFAGFSDSEIDEFSEMVKKYRNNMDSSSMDSEFFALRKNISKIFYDVYCKVFFKAIEDENNLSPVIEMFLHFGYMDYEYAGEENAKILYGLCNHIGLCKSRNVYTIYDWLKCVYRGEKESSKNELDMNFQASLVDLYKNGKITKEQISSFSTNAKMRVEYEIKNMFASVNKLTFGRVTTFCPIFFEENIINSIEKMLVTSQKIDNAINELRKTDYSIFYREVMFSDPEKGIQNEHIMKEVLPDIILMPNAGTKAIMWQETGSVKSDTPARFMFPIFTAVDISEMLLETAGRYRWEMCKRIQGIHWNDVREKSLTAEYNDFIQFYRKNPELSAEAKEKIKNSIQRAKNNYREVFVRDYINWILYESKGSFRLNKITRDILTRYCPFSKSIRNELKSNPLYAGSISRFESENSRKLQRFVSVYNKYEKAGGQHILKLKENIAFYEM